MKKSLLFLSFSVLLISAQAQAVSIRDYVALRGGYASVTQQSKEHYHDTNQTQKLNWDGDAAIGSVAYGLKIGYLRVEAEGNLSSETEKKKKFKNPDASLNASLEGKIQTSSIMFNSYLEAPFDFPVKPYISAGVGMGHIKARFRGTTPQKEEKTKVSRNHFAWQVGAGLSCEITPQWAFDVGYRIMDLGTISKRIKTYNDDDTTNNADIDISSKIHNVYAGMRYTF